MATLNRLESQTARSQSRKSNVAPGQPFIENGEKVEQITGIDDATLASVVANGEDLGPLIRSVFEVGKPEALLHQLRTLVKRKEVEIEDLCKVHYEEFIHAVDELRHVLVDADELRHGLEMQNTEIQEVGSGLLLILEELIEAHGVRSNLGNALIQLRDCKLVLDLCAKVNHAMADKRFYYALKTLDIIERDHLAKTPATALRAYVGRQIPTCRAHIERSVNAEFGEWLVQIRAHSKDLGKLAMGQASSARQRQVELGERQRQAEEQTRSGQRVAAYVLEDEDEDEDAALIKFDVTPVHRAHYIHTLLGLQEQFRICYFDNRKLQLSSDLQFTSGQFLPQAFSVYCAQVAGFFIVEDKIMRTAGGLVTPAQVDTLWETAVGRIRWVMEEQFARMATAEHMLLVKEDAALLCASLRRYGFQVSALLGVLEQMRDKYHELLLADAKRQISNTLANDKYEQMVMKKEYEYSMNVLAFRIQNVDMMPSFPYVAPFSATVPECCRIVRSFIDASAAFLSHSAQLDQYEAVKLYLDRMLTGVVSEAMLRIINSPALQVSHAMQLAANMTVLERACSFFAEHAAKLCGIPMRLVEGPHGGLASRAVLRQSQEVAHEQMLRLVKTKIDEMMLASDSIAWVPTEPPQANDYLTDLCVYLETMMETAHNILPSDAFDKVSKGMMRHVGERVVGMLCGDSVKRFNLYAVQGIDTDIRVLEHFADSQYEKSGMERIPANEVSPLKACLAEARQLINLLLAVQPENFMNKSVRERSYPALDPAKVIIVADKYRDVADAKIGVFGNRMSKQPNKKKALEALARKLREEVIAQVAANGSVGTA